MTTLGAVGGVSAALSDTDAGAQTLRMAQGAGAPALAPQERAKSEPPACALPLVHLMIGPGTLPSVGKDRMDLLRYRLSGNTRLTGEQMLEALPEIANIARVEVDKSNPYAQASHEDLRKLALRAEDMLRSSDVSGLVYVQGTNTLEETAYFLGLTVHTDKPIVVTGAQRPFNGLSSDAQMNLLDAMRLACAAQSRGKGPRWHSTARSMPGAMSRRQTPIISIPSAPATSACWDTSIPTASSFIAARTGAIRSTASSASRASRLCHTWKSRTFIPARVPGWPRRCSVSERKASCSRALEPALPGRSTRSLEEIVKSRSAVVVQSSRVGEGRIVRNNNWYEPGMVAADNLSPQKAAILLALALTKNVRAGPDPAHVRRVLSSASPLEFLILQKHRCRSKTCIDASRRMRPSSSRRPSRHRQRSRRRLLRPRFQQGVPIPALRQSDRNASHQAQAGSRIAPCAAATAR